VDASDCEGASKVASESGGSSDLLRGGRPQGGVIDQAPGQGRAQPVKRIGSGELGCLLFRHIRLDQEHLHASRAGQTAVAGEKQRSISSRDSEQSGFRHPHLGQKCIMTGCAQP
jgi:hypothetical protein